MKIFLKGEDCHEVKIVVDLGFISRGMLISSTAHGWQITLCVRQDLKGEETALLFSQRIRVCYCR